MPFFRLLPPGLLIAGLLAAFGATLRAGQDKDGFTAPIPPAAPVATSPITPGIDELDRLTDERGPTDRPQPRHRPRLTQGDFLSEAGRLRVHGGMSVTVGGGSGGSFHGSSAWVSYHDAVTGISVGVSVSQLSGGGLYGYPGYDYYHPRFPTPAYPYPVSLRLPPAGER